MTHDELNRLYEKYGVDPAKVEPYNPKKNLLCLHGKEREFERLLCKSLIIHQLIKLDLDEIAEIVKKIK